MRSTTSRNEWSGVAAPVLPAGSAAVAYAITAAAIGTAGASATNQVTVARSFTRLARSGTATKIAGEHRAGHGEVRCPEGDAEPRGAARPSTWLVDLEGDRLPPSIPLDGGRVAVRAARHRSHRSRCASIESADTPWTRPAT